MILQFPPTFGFYKENLFLQASKTKTHVSYNQLAINYNRCAENKYFLMTSNKVYLLKIKHYTVPAYV